MLIGRLNSGCKITTTKNSIKKENNNKRNLHQNLHAIKIPPKTWRECNLRLQKKDIMSMSYSTYFTDMDRLCLASIEVILAPG